MVGLQIENAPILRFKKSLIQIVSKTVREAKAT